MLTNIQLFLFVLLATFFSCQAIVHHHTFEVKNVPYTRLCGTKNILTVNGEFPGPTLYATTGDTLVVDVVNNSPYNITIHWHGVNQPRNPWSDGPEYITQCPIQPGRRFNQTILLTEEEGTLWWHAHSDWSRATVYGGIVIHPKNGTNYPFSKSVVTDVPPIIIGEWWKEDIWTLYDDFLASGTDPNVSDAYTINGQPGDLYPCSKPDTFKVAVDHGKTYLLRLINAALQDMVFFAVANHNLTVVGTDGTYTKPLVTQYITISPGQTIDFLLEANQTPNNYYMAGRVYSSAPGVAFDNTTTTAILQYSGNHTRGHQPLLPPLPNLPSFNNTNASVSFTGSLRSLADSDHPIHVPLTVTTPLLFTVSMNSYTGSTNATRIAASVNNISFSPPTSMDILRAYYNNISGVYGSEFPDKPPVFYNFTGDVPAVYETPRRGVVEVKVLEYNSTVEIVFQGTNILDGNDHPMHIHGTSFYVVGWGFGNFDKKKDPKCYNLVDPPLQNTIAVPRNGWTAIRFKATNPGVWYMHCHLERHFSWGMQMAFIIKNGKTTASQVLKPPPDMPPC